MKKKRKKTGKKSGKKTCSSHEQVCIVGWVCPKCNRGLSPLISSCNCSPHHMTIKFKD